MFHAILLELLLPLFLSPIGMDMCIHIYQLESAFHINTFTLFIPYGSRHNHHIIIIQ